MYLTVRDLNHNNDILVNGNINIPKGYLINTKIKSLKCFVKGILNTNNNLNLKINGIIKSSHTYPFELEISQNVEYYLQNNKNRLDINLIVWENVLLEIPINFMEETQGNFHDIIPESGRSE